MLVGNSSASGFTGLKDEQDYDAMNPANPVHPLIL
jgi:hypothetical protein